MQHHPAALAGLDPDVDAETACALFGITLEDLLKELEYRRQQQALRMAREMPLMAKQGGERHLLRGGRNGDGGYVDVQIHPVSYHYWGSRLGYECWQDKGFLREYKRDVPEARVKSVSDRLTIVKPEVRGNLAGNKRASGVRGRRGRWAL